MVEGRCGIKHGVSRASMVMGIKGSVARRSRKLTLLPLIAATYFMVAGGPYGLEDLIGKAGYRAAIIILLITPVLWSIPTALMVSELAAALPCEGGFYVWVRRGMGPFWGFQESWLTLTGSVFEMALYPTLFVAYLGRFAPQFSTGYRAIVLELALIALCAGWNILGAKAVGEGSIWLNVLLFLPFAAMIVIALARRSTGNASGASFHGLDLEGGIIIAMWNYMGWDNLSTIADEVDRPQTTYPLAMFGSVTLVIVSYLLPVIAVAVARLDPGLWTTGSWVDAGQALGGTMLALAIAAAGMIGAAGTFGSLMLSFTRLPGRHGRRRISAADVYAASPENRRAMGCHRGLRDRVGRVSAARFFSAAHPRRAADGLEHPAGIRRAHRFADPGTEPGAALPHTRRDFSHDYHHGAANGIAGFEPGAQPKRTGGHNERAYDRDGNYSFGSFALLRQPGIAARQEDRRSSRELSAGRARTTHQADEAVQTHADQEIQGQAQINLKHAVTKGNGQLRFDGQIEDISAEYGDEVLGPATRRGDSARRSRLRLFPTRH